MQTRFINGEGKEELLGSEHSFEEMVRTGRIKDDTLVWDNYTSAWRRATELDEYRAAQSGSIQRDQAGAGCESGVRPDATRDEQVKLRCETTSHVRAGLLLRTAPWILIPASVLLVVYAASRYGAGDSTQVAFRLGGLVGNALWIALVSFLLWRFAFKKKKGLGLLLFSVILLSLSVYNSIGLLLHVRGYRPLTRELRAIASDVASGSAIESRGRSKEARGTGPIVAEFVNDYATGLQNRFGALQGEMAAQHVDSMLTPRTLRYPSRIRQARQGLRHLNAVIDTLERSLRPYVDSARAQAQTLSIPANERAALIAGWDATMDSSIASVGLWFDIQRSTLGQVDSILALLLDREGHYTFSGGQVMFASQRDLDRFRTYTQNLVALAQKERDWRAREQGGFEDKLQQLEGATGK